MTDKSVVWGVSSDNERDMWGVLTSIPVNHEEVGIESVDRVPLIIGKIDQSISANHFDSLEDFDTFTEKYGSTFTPGAKYIYGDDLFKSFSRSHMSKNLRKSQIFDWYRWFAETDDADLIGAPTSLNDFEQGFYSNDILFDESDGMGNPNLVFYEDYFTEYENQYELNERWYYHDAILEFFSGELLTIEFGGFPPGSSKAPGYALKRDADMGANIRNGNPCIYVVRDRNTKVLYLAAAQRGELLHIGVDVPILTIDEFEVLYSAWTWANTLYYREHGADAPPLLFREFINQDFLECDWQGIPLYRRLFVTTDQLFNYLIPALEAFGNDGFGHEISSYSYLWGYLDENQIHNFALNLGDFNEIFEMATIDNLFYLGEINPFYFDKYIILRQWYHLQVLAEIRYDSMNYDGDLYHIY
ncbi:MAG: hypothetical protein ACTSRK_18705 [Promethearchaeota archaeon]